MFSNYFSRLKNYINVNPESQVDKVDIVGFRYHGEW